MKKRDSAAPSERVTWEAEWSNYLNGAFIRRWWCGRLQVKWGYKNLSTAKRAAKQRNKAQARALVRAKKRRKP